jgi:hypothetical protein
VPVQVNGEFIVRAQGQPQFAEAVKRSEERRQDIEQILKFMNGA